MPLLLAPKTYDLSDCRTAHGRLYEVEVHDGDAWVPAGQLAVSRETVTHDGVHVHTIDYHAANHSLQLRGKAGDPEYRGRLNLTECGTAFVGTATSRSGEIQAIRGVDLEMVYVTERHLKEAPDAPFHSWDDLTIRSAWVDKELVITYLLGQDDVSDRVRVTKVDKQKGETTLEMVEQMTAPFRTNTFLIVLVSGSWTFSGTYTDDDGVEYTWRGSVQQQAAQARAAVFNAAASTRAEVLAGPGPSSTLSLQDLDNISSIQIVTDSQGRNITVDYAQTTCGGYFNKCLVNGLDARWIDGIYGHAYPLPPGVQQVFTDSNAFFKDNSVLGTGQMIYDNLGTSPDYKDLVKRIEPDQLKAAWEALGKSDTSGVAYQEVSNALYIQGYRDGVPQMQPYLSDDAESWAKRYYDWLTDTRNLLTWQIQVASKEFDNVKTRMYEWYVKLQVLAPAKDYGQQFTPIAYSALLGVNYSKSQWSEDLKPFLQALIENAIAGKVDPSVMDDVQRRAFEENRELLATLIGTEDELTLLVDGIAAAMTAYELKKTLQQLARDPAAQAAIGQQLGGRQYQAWQSLTAKGKVAGVLSMLFYGASAGFLIYTMVEDSKKPQTPKQVLEDVNLGVLSLAILVKGIEKLMSLGVGRFLQNFSAGGAGAFRTFAGDLALWFQEGGKVVPVGRTGKAFVAVFGQSSTDFMARRIGPAMAVLGLVLASFQLFEAIKTGDVRNIIFEALNTFIALAAVVLIGFELMSFAWAGPVGLAVAAVGIIIVLVQFIWNLIDPPKPPPDPITEFVDGPMVAQRFARAA